jgi:hypothetical protein
MGALLWVTENVDSISCMLASMSAGSISRRGFLAVGLVGLLGSRAAAAGKPTVTVYKEPT